MEHQRDGVGDRGPAFHTGRRSQPAPLNPGLFSLAMTEPGLVGSGVVVALQRAAGNRATSELIAGRTPRPGRGDRSLHVQRQPKPDAKLAKKTEPRLTKPRDTNIQDVVKAMNGLGGPYADLKAWTDTIKAGKFLGHPIDAGNYATKGIRPEFQAMLDVAAANVDKEFKKSGNPVPSDYGIRSIGGYREEISPHGAGVAIDIDGGDNPYIMHQGDEHPTKRSTGETTLTVELRPVYHRIAEFMLNDPIDGEQSIIPKLIGTGQNLPKGGRVSRRDRVEQYYDRLARESEAMRTYFTLMKDEPALKAHLAAGWKTAHPNATPPDPAAVVKEMWQDYALLGGAVPKGGPPGVADFKEPRKAGRPFKPTGGAQHDPASGFLTIPKEVVLGLGQAVPRWGAIDFSVQSGDVMHFDDSRGIGEPFYQAKEPAATAVAAENAAAEAAARAKADAAKAAGAGSGAAPAPTTPPVQRAGPDGTDHRTADSLLPGRSPVVQRCGTERHEGCPCMDDNRDASTTTKPVQAGSTGPTAQKTVRPESPDAALLPVEREEAETPKIDFPTSEETTTTKSSFTGDSAPHERTPHRVLSWEADTCCTNLGYPDPSATRRTRTGASCCNTHPRFVDAEAKRQGFDGAASCNPDHRGHTATVTPYGKGKVAVEVVCADTRRRHNDPEKRDTIELGFAPALKAYGEPSVRSRGEVAYGPAVPSLCDKVVTECDKNENPHEGQCLEEGCTTATTGTKGKPKNK